LNKLPDKVLEYRMHMHDGHWPLAQMLPLDTPLSVNIDPSSKCNFKCNFCPTGINGGGQLSAYVELAIDQLSEFPRQVKSLWLVKDGEPLLYSNIAGAILRAKKAGVAEQVKITTNGSLLNETMAEQLLGVGLDYIKFSIYPQNFPSVEGRVLSNLEKFYGMRIGTTPHIHCKIVDYKLNAGDKAQFLDVFSPICDTINIDSLMGWSGISDEYLMGETPTTAMNGITTLTDKVICAEPFKSMAVNVDGSVTTCCVDWKGSNRYGYVANNSLYDLWHGDYLKVIRWAHITGQRDRLPACNGCHYLRGLPETQNLDEHVERLKEMYDI